MKWILRIVWSRGHTIIAGPSLDRSRRVTRRAAVTQTSNEIAENTAHSKHSRHSLFLISNETEAGIPTVGQDCNFNWDYADQVGHRWMACFPSVSTRIMIIYYCLVSACFCHKNNTQQHLDNLSNLAILITLRLYFELNNQRSEFSTN